MVYFLYGSSCDENDTLNKILKMDNASGHKLFLMVYQLSQTTQCRMVEWLVNMSDVKTVVANSIIWGNKKVKYVRVLS
jgi:hypothetical protein